MNRQIGNLRVKTHLTAGSGKEFEGPKKYVAVRTNIGAGVSWAGGVGDGLASNHNQAIAVRTHVLAGAVIDKDRDGTKK